MRQTIYLMLLWLAIIKVMFSTNLNLGLINNLTLPQVKLSKTELNKRLNLINNASIRYVREGIYWAHFEKHKNTYSFERIVKRLSYYSDQQILGLFAYSNNIYAVNDKFYGSSDWRLMHRSAVALEKALHILPQIKSYEILNEMNSDQYFQSNSDPIATYKQLLGVLSRVLRRNGKTVVTGGLLLEGNFEAWLQMLTSKSAYDLYDVLAIHPYCYPSKLSEAKFNDKSFSDVISLIREMWRQNGLENKPIWITEIGWPHRESVNDLQRSWGWINTAEYCDRLNDLQEQSDLNKIDRVYLYAFEDDEWFQDGKNTLPFGLIDKKCISKGFSCIN